MSGNFADYLAIKNTLALYCVALDTKDFSLLEEVFVPDAVTIYPFDGGNMQGVDQIAAVISKRLAPITSQHNLTNTQHIAFYPDGKASAMTYFTATHFGKGRWAGHLLTAHGKYIDELIRISPGQWRIKKRETKFMGPRVGEPRVMEPSIELAA
ncbi:hypothetical protein MBLNU457_3554t1 [Dothideomycetes sp. NU457]